MTIAMTHAVDTQNIQVIKDMVQSPYVSFRFVVW